MPPGVGGPSYVSHVAAAGPGVVMPQLSAAGVGGVAAATATAAALTQGSSLLVSCLLLF